jgi:carbamoyl-phosphate synthase large subunit
LKDLILGISGINATDNPGPGVAAARSLKEAHPHMNMIGLSYDVHDPGNYLTELFSNTFLMPYPSRGWSPLKTALEEIQTKTGMNLMIPCLDAELPLLIRYQPELNEMGIRSFLPTAEQFELRSKDKLVELSKELQCHYPKTVVAYSFDEVAECLRSEIPLPAVVKGKYYKAYTVYNIDTAILKGTEIASEWGMPLLVQERISGQEINLIGVADGNGSLLGRVAIKKQLTTQLGKVWTAVTIHDDLLNKLCERFCKVTQWRGPFELECIRNKDGIHLIEINPRFPAWLYFATGVGVNLPQRLVDFILYGKCETSLDYPAGRFLVRQTSEFVTDLSYFQNLLSARNREGI